MTAHDRFACFDRRAARPLRRLKIIELGKLVERRQTGLFRNPDGALSLHIGMTANGADIRPGLADVAAQQREVADHVDVLDAHEVLCQAHAVDHHHCVGVGIGGGGLLHFGTCQTRYTLQLVPLMGARGCGEFLEAGRVFLDEIVIENVLLVSRCHRCGKRNHGGIVRILGLASSPGDMVLPGGLQSIVGLDERLADAEQRGDVAAIVDLVIFATKSASPCRSASATGDCGLTKRSSPRSRSRLKVTIFTPRSTASCRS